VTRPDAWRRRLLNKLMDPSDIRTLQNLVPAALQALENEDQSEALRSLTILHQVIQRLMPELSEEQQAVHLLNEATDFLNRLINDPAPCTDLPANLQPYASLGELSASLRNLRLFLLNLVKGDLTQELSKDGFLAGILKSLQANLRHLTWQTQMIASGDFSQRVDFMGEFSVAFNDMVTRLDESLRQIKEKEAELTRVNQELRQEVELRRSTEESLRQSEELFRQLAVTDPLTGIHNRRYFYQLARMELERSCRYHHALAVVMFDVDHFKRVNDHYGHAIGDQVLQTLAGLVRNCLRSNDIFARYGGEEFIMLLPETDLQAASLLADRVRRQVAEKPLVIEPNQVAITISAGCSALDHSVQPLFPQPKALDLLIDCADKALYQAKRAGRNRTHLSDAGEQVLGLS
jgi:diguanylate cyclase (GGDEF)-like protein